MAWRCSNGAPETLVLAYARKDLFRPTDYASRYNEPFSENTDLVGLGLAIIGAALSGAFVVNGSPTKTEMVDSASGRTQLSLLVTASIVLLVLLFLTKPLAYMPEAVLSAVVFLIGIDLIDVKGMYSIFVQRRSEFWVALIASLMVIFVGVEEGIIVAIVLSLIQGMDITPQIACLC